jgi:hypothetical protein
MKNEIELKLNLPERVIKGVKFEKVEKKVMFEKHKDGKYYSGEVIFCVERYKDQDGGDILSEYLDDGSVRSAFSEALGEKSEGLKLYMPEKSMGRKKYKGWDGDYWLKNSMRGSRQLYYFVDKDGVRSLKDGGDKCGCMLVFEIEKEAG